VALYKQGRLPVNKLLTHRMKLDDINAGFERLREGKAVRQVVTF
jgi:alcohol dehydrogenase